MVNFLRMLLGVALLPACWGVVRVFADSVPAAAGDTGGVNAETIALLGGMVAFAFCWMALSHPVRTYVLGHELTHALWGLCFGAVPSRLRVGRNGGSVNLTRSNLLITLAPYFFPFYTFVVIVAALVTFAFFRPLPWLPLWMFMIGFTWAFHILFTLETLTRTQPDVRLYGRIFSWTFIFLANVALVLLFLVAMTPLTFSELWGFVSDRIVGAYLGVWRGAVGCYRMVFSSCIRI